MAVSMEGADENEEALDFSFAIMLLPLATAITIAMAMVSKTA